LTKVLKCIGKPNFRKSDVSEWGLTSPSITLQVFWRRRLSSQSLALVLTA